MPNLLEFAGLEYHEGVVRVINDHLIYTPEMSILEKDSLSAIKYGIKIKDDHIKNFEVPYDKQAWKIFKNIKKKIKLLTSLMFRLYSIDILESKQYMIRLHYWSNISDASADMYISYKTGVCVKIHRLDENPYFISDYVDLKKENAALKNEVNELKAQLEELRFRPGGDGYLAAKESWESRF